MSNKRPLATRTTFTYLVILLGVILAQCSTANALWYFQDSSNATLLKAEEELPLSLTSRLSQAFLSSSKTAQDILSSAGQAQEILGTGDGVQQQQQQSQLQESTKTTLSTSAYSGYGSSLLSMAGIQPSTIANVLNTVGDTGFSYFNIQDQCRNRAACDLGFMLYKKLSYLHNWLIRASVRSLTDMNNIYTQSWMEGMLGKNCTMVFMTCRQSPLEGLMNLAVLQSLAAP